jgi:hypothetical protein
MWWFIVDAETNAMQTMMHSSMVYCAPSLVGYATLLLGLVRDGGWRWRAGGRCGSLSKKSSRYHTVPYEDCGPRREEEDDGHGVESVSFPLKVV